MRFFENFIYRRVFRNYFSVITVSMKLSYLKQLLFSKLYPSTINTSVVLGVAARYNEDPGSGYIDVSRYERERGAL